MYDAYIVAKTEMACPKTYRWFRIIQPPQHWLAAAAAGAEPKWRRWGWCELRRWPLRQFQPGISFIFVQKYNVAYPNKILDLRVNTFRVVIQVCFARIAWKKLLMDSRGVHVTLGFKWGRKTLLSETSEHQCCRDNPLPGKHMFDSTIYIIYRVIWINEAMVCQTGGCTVYNNVIQLPVSYIF